MREFFKRVMEANRNINPITLYLYIGIAVIAGIMLLGKVAGDPKILIIAVAFYFAIVIHEIAHGVAAFAFGDPTAKMAGRFTLNPAKHLDPAGTIIPIVLMVFSAPFIIGWAKPVPVNYRLLKSKNIGIFFVSIAGVVSNLLMALLGALYLMGPGNRTPFMIKLREIGLFDTIMGVVKSENQFYFRLQAVYNYSPNFRDIFDMIAFFAMWLIFINIVLAVFNLIPCPPLDGSRVIYALGNDRVKEILDSMEKYGFIILIVLLAFGVIDKILIPVIDYAYRFVFVFIGL